MAENKDTPDRPDLAKGIAEAELADGGMLVGHVEGKSVLLVRRGRTSSRSGPNAATITDHLSESRNN